jgi:hypothetical protein
MPERVWEAFKEELEELADILLDGNGWSSFSIGVASSGDLVFPFMIVGWREEPGVQVNTNNLVHVQLQPHLYKPPRAIDTCYSLAGVHLGDSLMKHVVYTTQEVFPKGKAITIG